MFIWTHDTTQFRGWVPIRGTWQQSSAVGVIKSKHHVAIRALRNASHACFEGMCCQAFTVHHPGVHMFCVMWIMSMFPECLGWASVQMSVGDVPLLSKELWSWFYSFRCGGLWETWNWCLSCCLGHDTVWKLAAFRREYTVDPRVTTGLTRLCGCKQRPEMRS
jgi:hypothetical protein